MPRLNFLNTQLLTLALNHLTAIGILEEVSGHKRDKVYIYRKYLDILEHGAEPFAII